MNLQAVSKMNDAAQAAFKTFSKRARYRSNTPVQRFHQELEQNYGKIDLDQLLDMFKALEKQGVGSLVISRKPYQTRFKWGYSLRDVARVASGEINIEEALKIAPKARSVGKRPQIERPKGSSAPLPTADVIVIQDGKAKTISLTPEQEKLFNAAMTVFQRAE